MMDPPVMAIFMGKILTNHWILDDFGVITLRIFRHRVAQQGSFLEANPDDPRASWSPEFNVVVRKREEWLEMIGFNVV